jgi:hypothetical protein
MGVACVVTREEHDKLPEVSWDALLADLAELLEVSMEKLVPTSTWRKMKQSRR